MPIGNPRWLPPHVIVLTQDHIGKIQKYLLLWSYCTDWTKPYASIIGRSFTNFVFFYVDRNSKMTTTAGHSFYIGPIVFFYNQVNDTGSWEPLVVDLNSATVYLSIVSWGGGGGGGSSFTDPIATVLSVLIIINGFCRSKHYIRLLFHFIQAKASRQIPKDKSLHHSKCLLIMWNISNFDAKFWLFSFTDLINNLWILYHLILIEQIMFQKYLSFLLLAVVWRWNYDRGN